MNKIYNKKRKIYIDSCNYKNLIDKIFIDFDNNNYEIYKKLEFYDPDLFILIFFSGLIDIYNYNWELDFILLDINDY